MLLRIGGPLILADLFAVQKDSDLQKILTPLFLRYAFRLKSRAKGICRKHSCLIPECSQTDSLNL